MNCTRCNATGFLNTEYLPEGLLKQGVEVILKWIADHLKAEVQVCDCCGDGEEWYGTPGEHYTTNDPIGYNGPYAYNGGLCECH